MKKALEFLRKNQGSLLALAAGLLTALALFSGSVSVRLEDDGLRVGATLAGSERLLYDDIRSARLVENVDPGRRVGGMRTLRVAAGSYVNDEFGGYTLFSYARVPLLIDISTGAGRHVVFNGAGEEETRALYDQLLEKLPDIP